MSTANNLLKDQKTQSFEDLVLNYSGQVIYENVYSLLNSPIYEALWTFKDGSTILLKDFIFEEGK